MTARVLGVLNVTPDSFSDGGLYADVNDAIAHGRQLAADGADLVDVGGESTRPGAARVATDEEQHRVLPVIRALAADGVRMSIDTMNAATARAAVAAGVSVINDVSGGRADPDMPAAAADLDVPFIAMHWRGHSADMETLTQYDDVVGDVCAELRRSVESLRAAGVRDENIILDPGLGFAKTRDHDWQLLRRLDVLGALGFPLLVGASRKRSVATLVPDDLPRGPRRTAALDTATATVSALAEQAGVWGVRVHNVLATRMALRTVAAWNDDEKRANQRR